MSKQHIPLEKLTLPSKQPPSKNCDPAEPLLIENLVGGSTSPQQKGGIHNMHGSKWYIIKVVHTLVRNSRNHPQYFRVNELIQRN